MSPHIADAVPTVKASQIFAIPSQAESPVAATSASTRLMSTRPPPSYTEIQSPPLAAIFEPSPKLYWAAFCTKRPLVAEQACTHWHIIIATVPSSKANCPACTPTNSCCADAAVGRFGLLDSLSPVRNVSQPAVPRSSPRHASATYVLRYIGRVSSGLVVQGDREHERTCLRIVEVVHATGADVTRNRAAEVGLGIVAGVVRPRLQVAAADAEVDAREAEGALHPRRVERVADRDLAQLHEARILDARLVDPDERASRHVPVPVLADRDRLPRPRPHDRAVIPATLAENLGVPGARRRVVAIGAAGALLRVTVGPIAPERALGAVPDLTPVPDVEQAGELQLADSERRADAAGPIVIRVLHDTRNLIADRVPVGSDIQR